LVVLAILLLFLIVDARRLLPASQVGQIATIIVSGEGLLLELVYLVDLYQRKPKPPPTTEEEFAESLAPKKAFRLRFNHFILISLVTFDLFLLVPAYIVSLPALSQQASYNIVSILVTVQGIMLGLLGVSALQFTAESRILKPLVATTIISLLVSVATVMLDEASSVISESVLTGFFFASVVFFSAVVGAYSWFILESRAQLMKSIRSTPSTKSKVPC
jgi:hypothetical protein